MLASLAALAPPRPPVCEKEGPNATCRATELGVSARELEFPSTRVGALAVQHVAVHNPDPVATVEIDEAKVTKPGLGDFEIYGANATLAPGAQLKLAVGYRPATTGSHRSEARIFASDGRASPVISLRGTATEPDEQRERRVQEAESVAAEGVAGLPHFPEREQARMAIEAYSKRVEQLAIGAAEWAMRNWTTFLASTGGDFTVAWTEGHFTNVLGDVLSMVVGGLSKNPVVEATLSALSSIIYDAAFTHLGNRETERTVYEKVKQTGDAIDAKHDEIALRRGELLARARETRATALAQLHDATRPDQIAELRTWAVEAHARVPSPPPPRDRSLRARLLQEWVLERAVDARRPRAGTNRDAYATARTEVLGLAADAPVARRDLFVFQARYEWQQLGLGGIDEATAQLADRVTALERQGESAGLRDAALADLVVNMLGHETWSELPIVEPERTRHVLGASGVLLRDLPRGRRLGCLIHLTRDAGSVIARRFRYYLDGHVGAREPA